VIHSHLASLSVLDWFFGALAIVALGFEGFALIDAIRRPGQAFLASSKQTKPLWLVITSVATVIGLYTVFAVYSAGGFAVVNILSVVAFVAAAIYLTDVRPRVREFRKSGGGSGTHMGPYGPW
jgi:hypothetical protein